MNLFIELHEAKFRTAEGRFGTGWENLFTEQLAFFLTADLGAATSLARLFLRGKEIAVVGVITQPSVTHGKPDLRIEFEGGTCLHVEHKFDAPLGHRQLQGYLCEGQVALVSRCSQTVPDEVLGCADYLHPSDRHYFNWVDVYEAIPSGTQAPDGFGALRDHFRGYMRELDLGPTNLPSEWRRLFEDRINEENRRVQKDFGRLLDPVKSALRDRGLRVSDAAYKGKYADAPPGAWWRHLFVLPSRVRADYLDSSAVRAFDPGFEGLVVELVCEDSESECAWTVYEAVRVGFTDSEGRTWYAVKPRPIGRTRLRVSLAAPLVPLLKGQPDLSRVLSKSATEALEHLLAAAAHVQSSPPNNALEPSAPV